MEMGVFAKPKMVKCWSFSPREKVRMRGNVMSV